MDTACTETLVVQFWKADKDFDENPYLYVDNLSLNFSSSSARNA